MRIPFILLLALAACATPSAEFAGAARSDVSAGGFEFTVYENGTRAQAYRRTMAWGLDPAEVMAAGILAIEEVSGCPVREGSVKGDYALMTAEILC